MRVAKPGQLLIVGRLMNGQHSFRLRNEPETPRTVSVPAGARLRFEVIPFRLRKQFNLSGPNAEAIYRSSDTTDHDMLDFGKVVVPLSAFHLVQGAIVLVTIPECGVAADPLLEQSRGIPDLHRARA